MLNRYMKRQLTCALLLSLSLIGPLSAAEYFPPRGDWERISPAAAGFKPEALKTAVALAQSRVALEPRDLRISIQEAFGREPNFRILGPTGTREGGSGLIIRGGKIVAEWGDLSRPEMTFSVVKSYLSTVAGLAWGKGLIRDLNAPVAELVKDGSFASEHNRKITWHHLLNQTSDWSGELWETWDWADRPVGDDPSAWAQRARHEPGSFYKYNDVRVNLLAYSLLQVLREPLPVVLRRELMDPIGASPSWRWHGYDNSWVTLDGQSMQSVSGGGHFGGGLFIDTLDHARFGLLMLREGRWQDQQLVPDGWLERALRPSTARSDYGYLWWLNTNRERIPAAPEAAFWAAGFGGNYIYMDPEHDLLLVLRWTPALEEIVTAIMAALVPGS